MGWGSGSNVANDLDFLLEYIPEDKHIEVAVKVIETFEAYDCDTMRDTVWFRLVWEWSDEKDDYVNKRTGELFWG